MWQDLTDCGLLFETELKLSLPSKHPSEIKPPGLANFETFPCGSCRLHKVTTSAHSYIHLYLKSFSVRMIIESVMKGNQVNVTTGELFGSPCCLILVRINERFEILVDTEPIVLCCLRFASCHRPSHYREHPSCGLGWIMWRGSNGSQFGERGKQIRNENKHQQNKGSQSDLCSCKISWEC